MSLCTLAADLRQSRAALLLAAIGGGARITLYSGTAPTSPDVAPSGAALVQFIGPAGSFGTAVDGVVQAGAVLRAFATTSGFAGWARIATAAGVGLVDLDVGLTGEFSVVLNTMTILSGGDYAITSLSIAEP